MIALVGVGTHAAIAGAIAYFVAHATYKSALFLAAGAYDHVLGTRDVAKLRGGVRLVPLAAAGAALACVSMAGLVPALGYVAKEEALKGLLHEADAMRAAVAIAIVLALAFTVAASIRLAVAPFRRADPASRSESAAAGDVRGRFALSLWPAVLGGVSVLLGVGAQQLSPAIEAAAGVALGTAPADPLSLWHGFTPAFALSLTALAAGAGFFFWRRHRGWPQLFAAETAARAFD
jgi:multicomponent Na+:H+ antiporter subunit A